jgi:hypothetical protein
MIAEEKIYTKPRHNVGVSNEKLVDLILKLMKYTVSNFKTQVNYFPEKFLNEGDLTQKFEQQAQILIRKLDCSFNIDKEYRDDEHKSKGIPDLYFYPNDENQIPIKSIFSIECKRLPAPTKKREKEYVVGDNNNGGIERFKTEKHGAGLDDCGMIGFVEQNTFSFWHTTINQWITGFSETDTFWQKDEILSATEIMTDFAVLKSNAHKKTQKPVHLHHLWINIQK